MLKKRDMDREYGIDLRDVQELVETERDRQYDYLEQKRKKLNSIWCTIYVTVLIIGILLILVTWLCKVDNWRLIANYTVVAFLYIVMILAIVVRVIDRHYISKERKLGRQADIFGNYKV